MILYTKQDEKQHELQKVERFSYLGAATSPNNKEVTEIQERIEKATKPRCSEISNENNENFDNYKRKG